MATASGRLVSSRGMLELSSATSMEDSSDSDGETEPAKNFHRRISTNKEIKTSVCLREGFLMKHTNSLQRWKKRYFKLKGRRLYYAKDTKSVLFDDIDLSNLSVAECSTKNINHSFQGNASYDRTVMRKDRHRDYSIVV